MRQMKDSGIEWIGQIPQDWNTIKLKNIYSDSCAGEVIDKSYWNDGNELLYTCQKVPMLSSFNVFPIFKRTKNNDLLLTRNATPYIFIPKNNSIYSNVVQRITIPNNYDNRFVRYSLICGVDSLTVQGDTIPSYNMQVWNNIIIPDIPLYFQKRIADFLDDKCSKIDQYIEKQQQIIEKLKAYKQSVITEAVTIGLDPDVPMKDSGIEWIGMIPENWHIRKLKTFASSISKGTTPKDMSNEQNGIYAIRFLKSENIIDNQLLISPEFYIEKHIHFGELKRSALTEDDILFVIAGASIGKVAIMDKSLLPSNTNQAICFIRIMKKYENIKKYIWYSLQSNIIKTYISLFSVQSAQPNISMKILGSFKMPCTDDWIEIYNILEYLDNKCAEIDSAICKKQSLIDKLTEYKKSLIYEAVTGKLEVR